MKLQTSAKVGEIRTSVDGSDLADIAEMHAVANGAHLAFVRSRVLSHVVDILADDKRYYFNAWLARIDNKPAGFAVGSCNMSWYSNEFVATLDTIFVRPEYRGTRTFLKLMREFEEWARLHGASAITASIDLYDGRGIDRIERLFPKLGYRVTGRCFQKLTKGQ